MRKGTQEELPYFEPDLDHYLNYDFHRNCWRYQRKSVEETEHHPCYFCGSSLILTTRECDECGIMICPECGHCLCSIPLLTYITLIKIHENYCCHLDTFKGTIKLEGIVDNALVKNCEHVLTNCAKIEGIL